MQAAEVVRTIEWMQSLVTPQMRDYVFGTRLIRGERASEEIATALTATHDWANVARQWRESESAVTVLRAFELSALLEPNAPVELARLYVSPKDNADGLRKFWTDLASPFRDMVASATPWKALVVPEDLQGHEEPENIISFTVLSLGQVNLRNLSQALAHLLALYDLLAEFLEQSVAPPEIVSIQSGSPISLSLKGSGEVIKRLKELISDVWDKVRFRAQQKQVATNQAILSSLEVIEQIRKKEISKVIEPEAAEKLRKGVIRAMSGLLSCHTLPTEMLTVQLIPNKALLSTYNDRLLPDQTTTENSEREPVRAALIVAPRQRRKRKLTT